MSNKAHPKRKAQRRRERKPREWWMGRIQAGNPECYTIAGWDVREEPTTGYIHVIEVIEG